MSNYNEPVNKITFDDEEIKEIERLSARLPIEKICFYMGIAESTFEELRKRDPRCLRAYKRGRAKLEFEMADNVINGGLGIGELKGDTPRLMFYLKTQCDWREIKEIQEVKSFVEPTSEELKDKAEEARLFLEFKEQRKKEKN